MFTSFFWSIRPIVSCFIFLFKAVCFEDKDDLLAFKSVKATSSLVSFISLFNSALSFFIASVAAKYSGRKEFLAPTSAALKPTSLAAVLTASSTGLAVEASIVTFVFATSSGSTSFKALEH